MAFLSIKTRQFTYFAQILGESNWHGKNVLDFGGNVGNILRDPQSTIDHDRYWCIDVVPESIEKGKTEFPDAHWVFYDRYSFFFNPLGVKGLPLPELNQTFDFVLAYSVFPNTSRTDMFQLVEQLEKILAPGGALAFTFIDPRHHSWPDRYPSNNLVWRLEREIVLQAEKGNTLDVDVQALNNRAKDARWFIVVNGKDLYLETEDIPEYEPERQQTHYTFYTVDCMQSLFPHATILPPANDEMQHCCVIRKAF